MPIPVAPVVTIVIGVNVIEEELVKDKVGLEDGVPAVHAADVVQGTPVQFSKAAFFHRTLISSTLKEDLRLIPSILSDSCLLMTWPFRLIDKIINRKNGRIFISKNYNVLKIDYQ